MIVASVVDEKMNCAYIRRLSDDKAKNWKIFPIEIEVNSLLHEAFQNDLSHQTKQNFDHTRTLAHV